MVKAHIHSTKGWIAFGAMLTLIGVGGIWLLSLDTTDRIVLKYAPLRYGFGRFLVADTATFFGDMASLEQAAKEGNIDALRALLHVERHTDGTISEYFPNTYDIFVQSGAHGVEMLRDDRRLLRRYGLWLQDAADTE
jgi:hypothetical protein